MRRIIHNSTAIAACLSLLAPHLAAAQSVGQVDPSLRLAQAETQDPQQQIEDELRRKLEEAEQAARDEAEAAGDPEPAGAEGAQQEADEAPVDAETVEEAESVAQEAGEADPETVDDAQQADEQPQDEAAKPGKTPKGEGKRAKDRDGKKPKQKPANAQQADDKPDQAADGDGKRRQKQDERAERKQKDRQQDAEAAKQKAERKAEKRQKKIEQQQAEKPQEQEDQQQQAAEADSADAQGAAADATLRLAEGETATTRAGNMSRLHAVLKQEVASGLTERDLSCLSGAAFPCGDSERLITPRGVVLERNPAGRFLLAPGNAQMYRVTESGDLVARAAEEDTVKTAASEEAARETGTSGAAALDDTSTRGDVREQRVTEANRRSSSEDFATSLRDALTQTDPQQAEARAADDGDSSDLLKALALGLGAVAVGSMLSNNRQVALSAPDRVVLTRPDGSQEVVKDEVALLRQPGSTVTTENFDDGSSRSIVTRADGSKVVTIRDANLRVLRRTLVSADGTTTRLIDDTEQVEPVDIASLPAPAPVTNEGTSLDEGALRAALQRESNIDRRFTLGQIRNIPEVRALVAPVNIDAITFDTGSAAISPDQARQLSSLGQVISEAITRNPREIFLIEGHTDTVGADAMNLALSDRRAESVALALTEYFDVPPENLVVQGYGEQFLKIRGEGDIRQNRRASVRRITELLQTAEAN
ncbi:OmpA family protein [Paracoccus salsus]|uniref:OmpA family protein n=1 Tax=Paracoccus salsus TaxID=2911061 RepID=UPI001F20ED22|nr:OmpA family protein [Paracoccus salsus]MCF3972559.1 OmpA family protein [Paracoccus salsus]